MLRAEVVPKGWVSDQADFGGVWRGAGGAPPVVYFRGVSGGGDAAGEVGVGEWAVVSAGDFFAGVAVDCGGVAVLAFGCGAGWRGRLRGANAAVVGVLPGGAVSAGDDGERAMRGMWQRRFWRLVR